MITNKMIPRQASSKVTASKGSNADIHSNGSSSKNSNDPPKNTFDNSEKNASSNSGYSADGSAAALAPPFYIGFLEANKKNGCEDNSVSNANQSRNSRRKAIELNFTASRAFEDLKKGGIEVPIIRMEKTRDLEDCKIDMSKVNLVMAKSTDSSPFLINRVDQYRKSVPAIASEYESLIAATYQSYEKHEVAECDSSTSSVSSSCDSDDGSSMPPPPSVVPPLLEDALKANATGYPKRVTAKRKCSSYAKAKLQHITLNAAFEACTQARVITLSFHPFIVVHVNTAYNRLSGYSSAKVLGKPLQDCLSGTCKEWMKVGAPHPVAALHDRVRTVRSKGNKHQQCRCQAMLVGPQLEGKKEVDTSSVTHYAVSFLPLSRSTSTAAESRAKIEPQEPIAPAHKQVVG